MNKLMNTRTNRALQIKLLIASMIFALSALLAVEFIPVREVAKQIALGMPALDAASKDAAVGGHSTPCVRADYCGDGVS